MGDADISPLREFLEGIPTGKVENATVLNRLVQILASCWDDLDGSERKQDEVLEA
jgi:hypothetical protein